MTRQKLHHRGQADTVLYPGISGEALPISTAVAPLDRLALAMDEKWGVDALIGFVSPATAARYGKAMAVLKDATDRNDLDATIAAATNCIRGLHAMDAEATAAGCKPAPADVWQIEIDGKVYAFARDIDRATRAKVDHPDIPIFTLREAVVALRPTEFGLVGHVKAAIPGAEIVAIRKRTPLEEELNDEIRF